MVQGFVRSSLLLSLSSSAMMVAILAGADVIPSLPDGDAIQPGYLASFFACGSLDADSPVG